jgi:hypothetical protein
MNLHFSLTMAAIGISLLFVGFDSADSIATQCSRLFSGQSSGQTAWLVVGGCICLGIGLVGAARARFAKPLSCAERGAIVRAKAQSRALTLR